MYSKMLSTVAHVGEGMSDLKASSCNSLVTNEQARVERTQKATRNVQKCPIACQATVTKQQSVESKDDDTQP